MTVLEIGLIGAMAGLARSGMRHSLSSTLRTTTREPTGKPVTRRVWASLASISAKRKNLRRRRQGTDQIRAEIHAKACRQPPPRGAAPRWLARERARREARRARVTRNMVERISV